MDECMLIFETCENFSFYNFTTPMFPPFSSPPPYRAPPAKGGELFYAYATPIVFVMGTIGCALSMLVFLSKNLRRLSASRYLAMLSASDMCTLWFYVLVEWLRRGIQYIFPQVHISFFETAGVCQVWVFFSYLSRLTSAWLIVAFTCERFVGVCMPMRRRRLASRKDTSKIIFGVFVAASLFSLYKPIMSEIQMFNDMPICTSMNSMVYESFILDSIYAASITIVPFCIITVLNCLIIRKFIQRRKSFKTKFITSECHIRLEFTFILLAISFFFIALNLPFFVVWVRQFLRSSFLSSNSNSYETEDSTTFEFWREALLITRTIFYMNYCINFPLYSLTAASFRREFKRALTCSRKRETRFNDTFRQTRNSSSRTYDSAAKYRSSYV